MLYDILIVDNDFLPETNSTITDKSAFALLLDLIGRNLRVTCTSGEGPDAENLKLKDLSAIKYIFCDLYLNGITGNSNYQSINSKIMGIIKTWEPYFCESRITIYINSDFIYKENGQYGDEGVQNLRDSLEKKFEGKFSVDINEEKNALREHEERLRKLNLQVYLKSMIINKAVEVEKVFSDKLCLSSDARRNIGFQEKLLTFESQFLISKDLKKQVSLLQKIRNGLAHMDADNDQFNEVGSKYYSLFWGKILGTSQEDKVRFNNVDDVAKYIKSIDELVENLREVEQRPIV